MAGYGVAGAGVFVWEKEGASVHGMLIKRCNDVLPM